MLERTTQNFNADTWMINEQREASDYFDKMDSAQRILPP